MQNHERNSSTERMSRMLDVSRSGYYHFTKRKPSQHEQEDERLLLKIKMIYKASRQTYRSSRIHAELKEQDETCSRKRVTKLMKKAGIVAKMTKKFNTKGLATYRR